MASYFDHVYKAENTVFGDIGFLPSNARVMGLTAGEVSFLDLPTFGDALNSDLFIVFGASYIKGDLVDFLIDHKAINCHMGVSPYFRGTACNFWALHDGHPELVGATVHLLNKGLDSGAILYHAFPGKVSLDPFELGMYAVKATTVSLARKIASGEIFELPAHPQDKSMEIRYSRDGDFTEEIAEKYLMNVPAEASIESAIENMDLGQFIEPFVLQKSDL